jgi:autotransporter-associated beta strand protein
MLTTPAISGTNPVFPVATGSAQTFTISGSNFQSGCSVTLMDIGTSPATTYPNITISSQSSTQIVINPNFGTAHHAWNVQVINPGSVTSNQYYFAVTPSGEPQPTRFGVDYSYARPSMSSLKAAGSTFAVRYVSSTSSKNISASEAQSLLAAGLDIILVFEDSANQMLNGYNQGVTDANIAVNVATAAGAPSNFFCYFAADFDATQAQQTQIDAYLNGASSILGLSRVGLYGGYYPVSRALNDGTASKGWQTVAWSGGLVDSRISLYQFYGSVLSGSCDADVGFGTNLGQWSPTTPTGLAASATGSQSISISWNTTYVTTSYTLDRATSSSGPWAQVYSGSTPSYTNSGLASGTTYYYKVCANNGGGSSAFSSVVSATTMSGVPTGLAGTATSPQAISVTWNSVTGATSYILDRGTTSSGPWTQIYSGSTASYPDSGLQFGTTYYYKVCSSSSGGNSAFSSPVSAATLSGVPTGLTATVTGPQSISLTWNTVSDVTTYTLQSATSSSGPWTQVYSGSTASYPNSGLQPGTKYYYEVKSSTSTGSSAYSSAVAATTPPTVTVISPASGQVFTSYPITVIGTASDSGGTGLASVTVTDTTNGSTGSETVSGTTASFAVGGIVLAAGQNVIDVESFDNSGFYSVVTAVTITYSPPTWTGGGANTNWSTAGNWSGTAAAAGTDLVFADSTGLNNTNDLAAGTHFGNLTFNAGAGPFVLSGNSVNLSGIITNNSTNAETINFSLSGAYALTKTGSGAVVLSGTNSFTGGTVVTGGTLKVTTPAALPDGSDLTIGASALAALGAETSAPVVDSPSGAGVEPAAAIASPGSTESARAASANDASIQAALVNHLARNAARSQTWADTSASDDQQDQNSLDLRTWDAVLAEYGRT